MLVVGYTEHGGARHLIIRNPNDGTKSLLPEWMTFVETGAIRIVSCPRFYVNRLVELRALIDRLMAPSSGNHVPGGQSNATMDATRTGSVQDTAVERACTNSTNVRSGTAKGASQRGNVRHRSRKQQHRPSGGGR